MTDTEIYGNTWAVIPHGSMLVFLIIIIIVIYYLGFYFGIQMEKTNEQDRKLLEEERTP